MELFKLENLRWLNEQVMQSYQIQSGSRLCIVGTSGIGKTTFLQFFNLMCQPQEGDIYYRKQNIRSYQPQVLRREVVMNPQEVELFGPTIADDLQLYAKLTSQTPPTRQEMQTLLNQLLLSCTLETPVIALSGGEKQRVALARTLLSRAPVILLDEPTSALDTLSEAAIIQLLQSPEWSETTFIIVSHSQKFVQEIATQVLELTKGGTREW